MTVIVYVRVNKMTSYLRLPCIMARVVVIAVIMVIVNGEEEQTSGLAVMNEAPSSSPPLAKPTPLDVASPPQLPLLQPTPPPQSQPPASSDPLPGLFVRQ